MIQWRTFSLGNQTFWRRKNGRVNVLKLDVFCNYRVCDLGDDFTRRNWNNEFSAAYDGTNKLERTWTHLNRTSNRKSKNYKTTTRSKHSQCKCEIFHFLSRPLSYKLLFLLLPLFLVLIVIPFCCIIENEKLQKNIINNPQ